MTKTEARRRPSVNCSTECWSGKVCFRSQGEALNALRHIAIENAQAAVPMPESARFAYRCEDCGAWHLTKAGTASGSGRLH